MHVVEHRVGNTDACADSMQRQLILLYGGRGEGELQYPPEMDNCLEQVFWLVHGLEKRHVEVHVECGCTPIAKSYYLLIRDTAAHAAGYRSYVRYHPPCRMLREI